MNVKKTPVSILQEMMVKQGTTPSYELIFDGGGSHQNTFTYQVTCNGHSATGTGRCKKDAKHEAATAMLETIAKYNALPQLPATPCESPIKTPSVEQPVCPKSPANVPFRNAIGELQDLCATNNLNDPEYREISDVGPPHARIFTIHCVVSTFKEEGIATTKKQAKHEAARKMVERIMSVVEDPSIILPKSEERENNEAKSKNIAITKYPDLTPNTEIKSKVNWGLKIKNFYKGFKESFDEEMQKNLIEKIDAMLTLLEQCQNNFQNVVFSQLKENFETMLKSIDRQYYLLTYNCAPNELNKSYFISGIRVYSTTTDFHEIGVGNTSTEAEFDALIKIVRSLKFFLE